MPPTSPTGEEVVEKRASAPVSTACLIIACAALLGGIIFQVLEIAEYRSGPGDPKDLAAKKYKSDVKKLNEAVEEILSKATVGTAGTAPDTPDADSVPGSDAAPGAPPAGDSGEEKDSPPPADGDPPADADTPTDTAPGADEETGEGAGGE